MKKQNNDLTCGNYVGIAILTLSIVAVTYFSWPSSAPEQQFHLNEEVYLKGFYAHCYGKVIARSSSKSGTLYEVEFKCKNEDYSRIGVLEAKDIGSLGK